MDVYILSVSFQNTTLLEEYISCAWTDRGRELGEFEIVYEESKFEPYESSLAPGAFLGQTESHKVMRVDSVLKYSEDGVSYVKITGYSLEVALKEHLINHGNPWSYSWYKKGYPNPTVEYFNGNTFISNRNDFHDPKLKISVKKASNGDRIPRYFTSTTGGATVKEEGGLNLYYDGGVSGTAKMGSVDQLNMSFVFKPGYPIYIRVKCKVSEYDSSASRPYLRFQYRLRGSSSTYSLYVYADNTISDWQELTFERVIPANAVGCVVWLSNGSSKKATSDWTDLKIFMDNQSRELKDGPRSLYFDGSSSALEAFENIVVKTFFNDAADSSERTYSTMKFTGHIKVMASMGDALSNANTYISSFPRYIPYYKTVGREYDTKNAAINIKDTIYDVFYNNSDTKTLFGFYRNSLNGYMSGVTLHRWAPAVNFTSRYKVLSEANGELHNVTLLNTIKEVYNQVMVISGGKSVLVKSSGAPTGGFGLRTKIIDYQGDDKLTSSELTAEMKTVGKEFLSNQDSIVLECDINLPSDMVYEKDFCLGTIFELRAKGEIKLMYLSDYTFLTENGVTTYVPTFKDYVK